MSKRLQVIVTDEAFAAVERTYQDILKGQPAVKLNYSDVIEEMIFNSKISISEMRLKHTDLRRTLLDLSRRKDLDDDELIRRIAELKSVLSKKESKKLLKSEPVAQE